MLCSNRTLSIQTGRRLGSALGPELDSPSCKWSPAVPFLALFTAGQELGVSMKPSRTQAHGKSCSVTLGPVGFSWSHSWPQGHRMAAVAASSLTSPNGRKQQPLRFPRERDAGLPLSFPWSAHVHPKTSHWKVGSMNLLYSFLRLGGVPYSLRI